METPVDKPNLQRVRDWFLFATFTGLSYADLKRLSEKDITQSDDGTYWIHIRRQKTETPSAIRLLNVPLQIIEKYRHERKSDRIFNLYCRGVSHQAHQRTGTDIRLRHDLSLLKTYYFLLLIENKGLTKIVNLTGVTTWGNQQASIFCCVLHFNHKNLFSFAKSSVFLPPYCQSYSSRKNRVNQTSCHYCTFVAHLADENQ